MRCGRGDRVAVTVSVSNRRGASLIQCMCLVSRWSATVFSVVEVDAHSYINFTVSSASRQVQHKYTAAHPYV
mgnify:CR=1 FL=1